MEIAWQALVFKEKDFMALIDNFIASKYPNAGNFSFSATGGNNQIQYPKANSTAFKAKLEEDGREILAHLSGKMRLHFIRVLVGDRVEIEILPGDTRGRIVK